MKPVRPWPIWVRRDTLAILALGLLTALVRAAWRSRTLNTLDSVLFALGIENYDVRALRPHPPGYPLFVALGRAIHTVVPDPNTALVTLSVLLSIASVVLLYVLVWMWGCRRAAIVAGLLFSFAPAFLYNGVVALSYTALSAAALAVAILVWRLWHDPTPGGFAFLGLVLGFAGGMRQDALMFLGPLAVASLWQRGRYLPEGAALAQRAGALAGAGLLGVLVWLVPMARDMGGLGRWLHATKLQNDNIVVADALWNRGFVALDGHLHRLWLYTRAEVPWLLAAGALLGAAWILVRRERRVDFLPERAGRLLAWWLLPALLFFLIVFDGWGDGPIGYILILLPAAYVVGVLAVEAALAIVLPVLWPRPGRAAIACALVVLLAPLPALVTASHGLVERQVEAHDAWIEAWSDLPSAFSANDTAILVTNSFPFVKWHFPTYTAWTYAPISRHLPTVEWALVYTMRDHADEAPFLDMFEGGPRPVHPVPANIRHVVVWDFQLAGEGGPRLLKDDIDVQEARLSNGWRVLSFAVDDAHPTVESFFTSAALGATPEA